MKKGQIEVFMIVILVVLVMAGLFVYASIRKPADEPSTAKYAESQLAVNALIVWLRSSVSCDSSTMPVADALRFNKAPACSQELKKAFESLLVEPRNYELIASGQALKFEMRSGSKCDASRTRKSAIIYPNIEVSLTMCPK